MAPSPLYGSDNHLYKKLSKAAATTMTLAMLTFHTTHPHIPKNDWLFEQLSGYYTLFADKPRRQWL